MCILRNAVENTRVTRSYTSPSNRCPNLPSEPAFTAVSLSFHYNNIRICILLFFHFIKIIKFDLFNKNENEFFVKNMNIFESKKIQ